MSRYSSIASAARALRPAADRPIERVSRIVEFWAADAHGGAGRRRVLISLPRLRWLERPLIDARAACGGDCHADA